MVPDDASGSVWLYISWPHPRGVKSTSCVRRHRVTMGREKWARPRSAVVCAQSAGEADVTCKVRLTESQLKTSV